jgi:eukaryotic-like serine/threonine-protein kinase
MSYSGPVDPERWIAITNLTNWDGNPMFSPDGKTLYFNSNRDGFTCLWAVRLDLTGTPLAEPYPVQHFHSSPRHYTWYPKLTVSTDQIIIGLQHVQSDIWMTKLPE